MCANTCSNLRMDGGPATDALAAFEVGLAQLSDTDLVALGVDDLLDTGRCARRTRHPPARAAPPRRVPGRRRPAAVRRASDSGGMPTTVLLTMTVEQAQQRHGLVVTGHGGLLGVETALAMADQASVLTVVHDRRGRIVASGTQARLASKRQRLTLAGRDGGCSFPGCDVPPAWTEAHHVVEWSHGGQTGLDNLTLLCGYHHRHHRQAGWECRLDAGVPQWLPPAFIDPHRQPQRNNTRTTLPTGPSPRSTHSRQQISASFGNRREPRRTEEAGEWRAAGAGSSIAEGRSGHGDGDGPPPRRSVCRRRGCGRGLLEGGVQGDLHTREGLAHGTARFGVLGGLGETCGVESFDLAADRERDSGQLEATGRIRAE